MKYRQFIRIFIGLVIVLLLTSCTPWVELNQSTISQWLTLDSHTTIGQTFVADYSGLQAIHFSIRPKSEGTGTLIVHLRSNPTESSDIARVSLRINNVDVARSYRFDFSGITNSSYQYYYAFMSITGEGSLEVASGPANSYLNGAAYQDQTPLEAQLLFNLEYNRMMVIMGILRSVLHWAILFIAGLLLLGVPGWALLSISWKGWPGYSWLIKLFLSIPVSMAFYALLVLFTFLFHIQLGRWYVWLPVILGGLILLWKNRTLVLGAKFLKYTLKSNIQNLAVRDKGIPFWSNISLIIIGVLLFFSRFWAVRGLEQPMWNDSLHHTVITQLIIDHSGLFNSWLPYAAYDTFSMHFGFPLISALFEWLTGVTSGDAVLYMGQILSIFAILALYPLALRLTHGNRLGGVITVLVAGLLSPMPAYYINWGRYAQLAAQVILPVAIWMILEVIGHVRENPSTTWYQLPWMKVILTGAIIAGMILFEYRMVYVILTFILALCIIQFVRYVKLNFNQWLRELWSILVIGLTSIVLFLPWGLRLMRGNLIYYTTFNNNLGTLIDLVKQDYKTWQNVLFYVPLGMIILAVVGWVWSAYKKNWHTFSLGVWVVLMAAVYALILLHIPWAQYVQSFAVIISLYIPLGILLGYLTSAFTKWMDFTRVAPIVTFPVIIIFGVVGTWSQRDISNPNNYALVTRPDTQAMAWIRQNTQADALFLVEGMHENWVTNIVGTDAGWWIPLLTGRQNTIPPQYAIANEAPIQNDYSQKMIQLEGELEKNNLNSHFGVNLMCEYGITHIYIGQKHGMVGNKGEPLFTEDELASNPIYRLVYHQDRVYIYSVEGACDQ